jgi:hypothetical protein
MKRIFILLLLLMQTQGALRVWNSSGSTDANDGNNYTPTGVILTTDSIVLKNASVINATQTADLHVKALMILSTYTGTFFQDSMYTDTVDGTIYFGPGTNGTVRLYGTWIQTVDADVTFANNAGRIIMGKRVHQDTLPASSGPNYDKYVSGANFDLRGTGTIYFNKLLGTVNRVTDTNKFLGFNNLTCAYASETTKVVSAATSIINIYGKLKTQVNGVLFVPGFLELSAGNSFYISPANEGTFDSCYAKIILGTMAYLGLNGGHVKTIDLSFPTIIAKGDSLFGSYYLTGDIYLPICHEYSAYSTILTDTVIYNLTKNLIATNSKLYWQPYGVSYNDYSCLFKTNNYNLNLYEFVVEYDSTTNSKYYNFDFDTSNVKLENFVAKYVKGKAIVTLDKSSWVIDGYIDLRPNSASYGRIELNTGLATFVVTGDSSRDKANFYKSDPYAPCSLYTSTIWFPSLTDSSVNGYVVTLGDSLCDSGDVNIEGKFNQNGKLIRTFKNYSLQNKNALTDTVWRKGTTYVGGDLFRNPGTVLFDTSEYVLMNNGGGYSHQVGGTGTIPHLTIRDNRSKVTSIVNALSFGIIRQDSGTLKISGVTTIDTLYVHDSICGGDSIKINKKIIFYPGNKSTLTNTTMLGGSGGDTCNGTYNNIAVSSSGWIIYQPNLFGNYTQAASQTVNAASNIYFRGNANQIVMGNSTKIPNIIAVKGNGTNLTFGDSCYSSKIIDSSSVFVVNNNGKLKVDSLIVMTGMMLGGGNIWATKKVIQNPEVIGTFSGSLYLIGSGGDTCNGTWGGDVFYRAPGAWYLKNITCFNFSKAIDIPVPIFIDYPTISNNFDSTGFGHVYPETSSVVRASATVCPTIGGLIDTIFIKGAGAAVGKYGRILYGTQSAGIESWARYSADTVKIIDTIPAHVAGTVTRTVYDQYGGSVVADTIQYFAPIKELNRSLRSSIIYHW